MRILTLSQPWATLMAIGEKWIETRSWETRYRGELAIHAAKVLTSAGFRLCREEPFASVLKAHGLSENDLPLGAIVARTTLHDILSTNDKPAINAAIFESIQNGASYEEEFGDYQPNRKAWVCHSTRWCRQPIPYQGAQGIRELPEDVADLVRSMAP